MAALYGIHLKNPDITSSYKVNICNVNMQLSSGVEINFKRIKMSISHKRPTKMLEYLFRDCKDIYDKYLKSDRVKDHCHKTGKYIGAAHNECNIRYCVAKHTPVFSHNFSNYDTHLFIKELANFDSETRIISLSKEVYIAMSQYIRFMLSSYYKVGNDLSDESLHAVRHHFPSKAPF